VKKVFPSSKAELITQILERDREFYRPAISVDATSETNRFATASGLLSHPVPYERLSPHSFELSGRAIRSSLELASISAIAAKISQRAKRSLLIRTVILNLTTPQKGNLAPLQRLPVYQTSLLFFFFFQT
jgi:hypothetical protein